MQQCRAAGFEPDVRFELADLSGHAELIAAGHAVGLLPDLLWAGGAPGAPQRASGRPGARDLHGARRSSRSRPGIRSVREALADAFVARV
jgi:DNA-binding transcriptional LysR family regulator